MKEKRDSNTVDADIGELEQDLAEARQLLRDVDKPTPFRVELFGSILLVLAVVGVAFVLHRFFPNLNRHDLQFWGFAILAIPVTIGAFWIGIRNKRRATNRTIPLKAAPERVFQRLVNGSVRPKEMKKIVLTLLLVACSGCVTNTSKWVNH